MRSLGLISLLNGKSWGWAPGSRFSPAHGATVLRRGQEEGEYGGRRHFLSLLWRSLGATMPDVSGGLCTWRR
jgi:hypothetical protein